MKNNYISKIKTADNQVVSDYEVGIEEVGIASGEIYIIINKQTVGTMTFVYSYDYDAIYIKRMANRSEDEDFKGPKYKGVGTLLLEIVFRESVERGNGGRLFTESIENSGPFYIKNGFRKQSLFINFEGKNTSIGKLCIEYRKNPSEKLKKEIETHPYFEELKSNADVYADLYLNKKPLSFSEIISYGRVDQGDCELMVNLANSGNRVNEKKVTKDPDELIFKDYRGLMFLPDDIIANKMKEYGLKAVPVMKSERTTPNLFSSVANKEKLTEPEKPHVKATPAKR